MTKQAFSTDFLGTNAPFQKNILQAKKSHSSCIFQDATQSTLRIALPAEKESHDYSLSSFRWSSRFFSPSCSSLGGMQSDAATAHDSNGTLARNKRERERERYSLYPLSLVVLSLYPFSLFSSPHDFHPVQFPRQTSMSPDDAPDQGAVRNVPIFFAEIM